MKVKTAFLLKGGKEPTWPIEAEMPRFEYFSGIHWVAPADDRCIGVLSFHLWSVALKFLFTWGAPPEPWKAMVKEMNRDLCVVQVSHGLFGVKCKVYSFADRLADKTAADVRGRDSMEQAIEDAYKIWKAGRP